MKTLQYAGLLLVILLHASTASGTTISCQVPAVFVGNPTNLTCYFPEDLKQSQKSFCVLRCASDSSCSDECLCCLWDNAQPRCFTKEGFELLTQISYKVTVRIPTHEPATFRCDTTPPDKTIAVEACHFRFKESTGRKDSTPNSTGRSLVPKEDDGQGDATFTVYFALSVVIAFLSIVWIVVANIVRCRRRRTYHRTNVEDNILNEFATTMGEVKTVRLLLLGKTGSGKSTTGNTIFDRELFRASPDFSSVTSDCEKQAALRGNTWIEIVDSPGLFDTHKTFEEICTNIVQAVAGMHPGPHAVLYVVRVGRFTAEDYAAYTRMKALFDDSITRHIILVFTHGDDLEWEGKTLADLMASPNTPGDLKRMFQECGHRCQLFNNMASDPQPQVDELLAAVGWLVADNHGKPYSCRKYRKIGESLEEAVRRRLKRFTEHDLQRQRCVQDFEQKATELKQETERISGELWGKESQLDQEAGGREMAERSRPAGLNNGKPLGRDTQSELRWKLSKRSRGRRGC